MAWPKSFDEGFDLRDYYLSNNHKPLKTLIGLKRFLEEPPPGTEGGEPLPEIIPDIFIEDKINRTETGNSNFLAKNFGDKIRFNHTTKQWHVWDGTRWKRDAVKQVREFAKQNAKKILELAWKLNDEDKKKNINWAVNSESRRIIDNTLSLTESVQGIGVEETDFDQNPYLFNCNNGTFNFETGKFQNHNPNDNISKKTEVDYIENAECPYWVESLDVMFKGDKKMIRFIQRAIGLSLTGLTDEEALFFCYGEGKNGKSRFFDCIEMLLGDYYQKLPSEALMFRKFDNTKEYHIATLSGSRFAVASEIDKYQRFNERVIRDLTGGDKLNARFPYGRPFEFTPTHKLW
ncbi:phage/plasmid primase, P4 family, partial [Candidatus Latescibacterota bacterium]